MSKTAWKFFCNKVDIVYTIFCVYFNSVCFGDPMPSKEFLEFLWEDLYSKY